MIFDAQSLFSDKQAITATAASTNVIDFGAPSTPKHAKAPIAQEIGRGAPMAIRVQVTEAFDNLTTLKIDIEVDNDEAFSSAAVVSSHTATLAELVAGYVDPRQFMPNGVNKRYARLKYTVVGTAPTTGAIKAGLVFGNSNWSA